MNIVKTTGRFVLLLSVLFGLNSYAETMPFKVVEMFRLEIKLSEDGSGIIKNVHCKGCDFNFLRITGQSKATVKGIEVDIQQARERAGKMVMVSFNPQTQEVQYIRW